MIVYPAIDLRNGKCVRLYQGDYQRETVYCNEPSTMLNAFVEAGAKWVHIIDLDGAKALEQNQLSCIATLIRTHPIHIQIGGGIRSRAQMNYLLEQGAARVIVGSMAVKEPKEVAKWFTYFGADRITLALDIMMNTDQQPMVAINAWQTISHCYLYDLINYYQDVGLTHLLCTNIALDGTLNGPDYILYESLLKKFPSLKIQASGGVGTLADVTELRNKNVNGVIIGRALYENKFTLREALSC